MKKSISLLLISSILLPNMAIAEGGNNDVVGVLDKPIVEIPIEVKEELAVPVLETPIIEESVKENVDIPVIENQEQVNSEMIQEVSATELRADFEKPNFSAWTYVTYMVYSPELNAYFPEGDTIMLRGQVGDVEDIPAPPNSNLIYEKGPTTVTHGTTEQHIQVFYKLKDVKPMGGQISIKYLTTDGKVLENETFINGRVDSEYYVDVYDFSSRGYEFSHSTGAPLQGVFDANKKSIVVYYKPIKDAPIESAPITIQYKDETGLNIADSKTMKGNVGDKYNVEIPAIEGYTYKTSSNPLSGSYTDKSSTIVLTYSKNKPVEEAKPVTVNYVDEKGKSIKTSEQLTGKVGESFNIKTPEIEGYTYKSANKELTGKFTTSAQSITLTYAKVSKPVEQAKPVIVNYKDENGNTIKASEELIGGLNEDFEINIPVISGYTYKSADKALTGKFTTSGQSITLTYAKDSEPVEEAKPVSINYVDEKGQIIKNGEKLTGNLGESFTVKPPKIEGYTYKSANEPLTGTFKTNAQSITLTYVKDYKPVEQAKPVTVTYKDIKGNTIQEDVVLTGKLGEKVSVNTSVKGYTYKSASTDLSKLVFTKNAQSVALTFEKVVTPKPDNKKEVNTSKLSTEISIAKGLNEKDYTKETWSTFSLALANAEKVNAKYNGVKLEGEEFKKAQSEVDSANSELINAKMSLKKESEKIVPKEDKKDKEKQDYRKDISKEKNSSNISNLGKDSKNKQELPKTNDTINSYYGMMGIFVLGILGLIKKRKIK